MSRVIEVKDPAGNITVYTYDALNRLTKKDIRTPSGAQAATTYTYDAAGNMLSASNGSSDVAFAYDALNRPVETKQTFAGNTYPINYTYDVLGNRTSMATPWGKYNYTYDVLNRAASIANPQGITTAFKYDAVGRRIEKTIFKSTPEVLVRTSYSYDAASQLLNITSKAGGKVVAFARYTYDEAGNRTIMEDHNGVHTYRYDASNRLIVARELPLVPFRGEGFAYDRAGNRRHDTQTKDYNYDAANRLQENTLYTYTHDLNGNLSSRTEKGNRATITYAYNPEQQLSEVITPKAKIEYKYDPLGRRTEKSVNGSPLRYVYDNEDIIAMLDGSNALTAAFTHGPGIDEPLIMTRPDGANYFYHADGLGSIIALTDDKGETAQTIKYQAYGKPATVLYDPAAASNPYYFTARELDVETGLYYYRARYYDWQRGAFTQEDPIGFAGGDTNLYTYAGNNSVTWIDPYGFARGDWWDPVTYMLNLDAAKKIADEVKAQAPMQGLPGVHNGLADAWRHARWNQRMVEEIGWGTAVVAGYGHEIEAMLSINNRQPWNEFLMDLHNNRVGRDLAGSGLIPTEVKKRLRIINPKCSGDGGIY